MVQPGLDRLSGPQYQFKLASKVYGILNPRAILSLHFLSRYIVKLKIFDTAGAERFKSLTSMYFKCLFVFIAFHTIVQVSDMEYTHSVELII